MPQTPRLEITQQLALFLNNKPGSLHRVCQALAEARIKIYAISTSDTIDHSVVRMIVDKPHAALYLLEKHGLLIVTNEVIMIEGSNRTGSLADITGTLAQAGINIEYAYCATSPSASKGLLILRPSEVAKALKVLNSRTDPKRDQKKQPKPPDTTTSSRRRSSS